MSIYPIGSKAMVYFKTHGWWPCEIVDPADLSPQEHTKWEKRPKSKKSQELPIAVRDYAEDKCRFVSHRCVKPYDAEDARQKLETGALDRDLLLRYSHCRALGLPTPPENPNDADGQPSTTLNDLQPKEQTEEPAQSDTQQPSSRMVTRGKRTRVELPEPKVQQPPRKKKAHSSATHILTEKNESRNTIEPNNDQSSSQQQLNDADAEAPRSTRALEENKKRATRGSKTARNNKNVELTVREMTPFSILPTEHTSPTTTPVTLTENRVSDPIIDNANNDKDQSMIECEDHPRTAVSTDISFRPIEKEGQPVSAAEVKAFTPEQVDVSVKPFPEKLTIGDVPDPTPPLDMNKVRKIVVLRHRLQSILLGKPTTGASDWTKRTIVSILNDLEMTSVTHELLESTRVASAISLLCTHELLNGDTSNIKIRCLDLLEKWRMIEDQVSTT